MVHTTMQTQPRTIAVIGLGYVGLPLAVEFGKIRDVTGFDTNIRRVQELNLGRDSTLEVSSEKLKSATKLRFTDKLEDLAGVNTYIVTVPTPIDSANRPDLSYLVEASRSIGSILKFGDLIIFESTVYPGVTEDVCVPALEVASGLQFNRDFFCGYSPERVNPGDKVNTLPNIKKITSGSTPEAADIVDSLYNEIIVAGTWRASNIKVAEAAKVIENSQRDLNIAFVNELSMIFDRMEIDTTEVLEAAGSKWNFLPFRPGMVGGHCIGVDPYYLTHKAEQLGYSPQVILAGRRINDSMAHYAAQSVVKRMLQNGVDVARATVGVLGITFKENCPDIRNSKILDLIRELQSWNVNVVVTDPWADPDEVMQEYGISLRPLDTFPSVDGLIVAVGHQEYRDMDPMQLINLCKRNAQPVIGDLKSLYERYALKAAGFQVFRL